MLEVNYEFIRLLPILTGLGTMEAVARRLGVSKATFSNWCRGKGMSIASVELMAKTFNYPMGNFMKVKGKPAEIYSSVIEWSPISYNFPLLYKRLLDEATEEEIIRRAGISLKKLRQLKKVGADIVHTFTWQLLILLFNIGNLFPEPFIIDHNGSFPMADETLVKQPNYNYLQKELSEVNDLKMVRDGLSKKLEESAKTMAELHEKNEKLLQELNQKGTLIDLMQKGDSKVTKSTTARANRLPEETAEILEALRVRIKELAEAEEKDKMHCLGELLDEIDKQL